MRKCLLHNRAELPHYNVVETAGINRPGKVFDELVAGIVDFPVNGISNFICKLQFTGGVENRVYIEITLVELTQFIDLRFPVFLHIEFEERFFIHLVFLYQVGIKTIDNAVGQNAEAGVGYMEITKQLPVMRCKVFFPMFALNQNNRLAVFMNGIVDLFPFFNP